MNPFCCSIEGPRIVRSYLQLVLTASATGLAELVSCRSAVENKRGRKIVDAFLPESRKIYRVKLREAATLPPFLRTCTAWPSRHPLPEASIVR